MLERAIEFGIRELLLTTKAQLEADLPDMLPGVPLDAWERVQPVIQPNDPLPIDNWYEPHNNPTITIPFTDVVYGLNLPQNIPHNDLVIDCGAIFMEVIGAPH